MKNKLKIFCVFLCCIIIIVLVCCGVYSKYKNSINFRTNTGIAEPILEVGIKDSSDKVITVLNNDKHCYEFSVRNFNSENKVSDVELKYNIEFILSQKDAPIDIKLYRIIDNNEKIVDLENFKTVQCEMLNLNKTENLYKVEVMYDKNSNNIMNDNLEIKLNIQGVQEKEGNV